MAGGMQHAGAGISHMGDDGNELQRVHELDSRLARTLQTEGDDTTRTVGQILLCQLVALVAGQSAVVYPGYTIVGLQEFRPALLQHLPLPQNLCREERRNQAGSRGCISDP